MSLEHILILLGTGVIAGFASGLLGLGGAFLMTPVQYSVYMAMGLDTDTAIRMSFGTTLMVILPTAISGAWSHSRKGAVWWRAAIIMGLFSLLGSYAGSTISVHLPGEGLKIAFGVVGLAAGIRMFTGSLPAADVKPRSKLWMWAVSAFPIGMVTGILGIGGGVIVVPVLVMGLRFSMHHAIATSLGMMILTSVGGTIGYIVNGMGATGLPPWTIGYINLPSFGVLTVSCMAMAQVGATIAHRIPAKYLKLIFAIMQFYVGLRMIGVFQWLGLPI